MVLLEMLVGKGAATAGMGAVKVPNRIRFCLEALYSLAN